MRSPPPHAALPPSAVAACLPPSAAAAISRDALRPQSPPPKTLNPSSPMAAARATVPLPLPHLLLPSPSKPQLLKPFPSPRRGAIAASAAPPPPPQLTASLRLGDRLGDEVLTTENAREFSSAAVARFWWFGCGFCWFCSCRGVDVPARVRGGRGDEADEREGALLQRAHLPLEQDPDRQGQRDLRPHQRIRERFVS